MFFVFPFPLHWAIYVGAFAQKTKHVGDTSIFCAPGMDPGKRMVLYSAESVGAAVENLVESPHSCKGFPPISTAFCPGFGKIINNSKAEWTEESSMGHSEEVDALWAEVNREAVEVGVGSDAAEKGVFPCIQKLMTRSHAI